MSWRGKHTMGHQAACRAGQPVRRRSIALLAWTLLLTTIGLAAPRATFAEEWQPPRTVFIPSTGHTIDGLFLDVWRARPDILGDPITEEFRQRSLESAGVGTPVATALPDGEEGYIVQYFENVALVYLPENEPGKQVDLLPLGEQASSSVPREYQTAFAPATGCGSLGGDVCLNFPVQRHTLRFGFKEFWEANDGARMLGSPISEEFTTDDGATVQYFKNAALQWRPGEDVGLLPLGEDVAERLDLETKAIERPEDIPVYDELLFVPPAPAIADEPADLGVGSPGYGPGPQQGGYKEIVVSISAQSMWAYEGGELIISSLVSTGTAETIEVTTPIGYWSILSKYEVQTMEGTISNEYYRVEDVPHVMYFDNLGNALHGAYWHNNFGTPMSHGCVNLPLDVAAVLYDWAPIGTAVTVIP